MDIVSLVPVVFERLVIFILIFSRIVTLFSTFIVFSRHYVNPRIIISLTTILSIYVVCLDTKYPKYELFSIPMMVQLFFQIFVGFTAGFILNVILEIFTAVGQIISTQIGFSMITLIDPRFGTITPLTLFYSYVGILIFLFLNGHLVAIKFILDTFQVLPLNASMIPKDTIISVLKYSNVIFQASILLSMTIITCILLTNLTMAIMTRFAPQFNIFSIGINITIIFGLLVIYLTFLLLVNKGSEFIQQGLYFLQHIFTGIPAYGR
jgi:flagellar biosynthetic protein FliR